MVRSSSTFIAPLPQSSSAILGLALRATLTVLFCHSMHQGAAATSQQGDGDRHTNAAYNVLRSSKGRLNTNTHTHIQVDEPCAPTPVASLNVPLAQTPGALALTIVWAAHGSNKPICNTRMSSRSGGANCRRPGMTFGCRTLVWLDHQQPSPKRMRVRCGVGGLARIQLRNVRGAALIRLYTRLAQYNAVGRSKHCDCNTFPTSTAYRLHLVRCRNHAECCSSLRVPSCLSSHLPLCL